MGDTDDQETGGRLVAARERTLRPPPPPALDTILAAMATESAIADLTQALTRLRNALRSRRLWPADMRSTCVHKHWNWVTAVREQPEFARVLELAGDVVASRRHLVPEECATWLAWASTGRGPVRAVQDAIAAVEAATFAATSTVVLAGPKLTTRASLDESTTFLSFRDLPWSYEKVDYQPRPHDVHDGYRVVGPTSALYTKRQVTWDSAHGFPIDETAAEDFMRALALASRKPVVQLTSWQQHGLEVPIMRTSSFTRRIIEDVIHPSSDWTVASPHQQLATETWRSLRAFNQASIERLRTALDRLVRALLLSNRSSKAIDAGVAAEGLLVDGAKFNRRQVAQKSAWLLAPANEAERTTIAHDMREFYDLRSLAVHTGRVPLEPRVRGVPSKLEDALDKLVAIAKLILRRGDFPAWQISGLDGADPQWRPA